MSDPTPIPYLYRGTLVRTIDGDTVVLLLVRTFEITLDVGFHTTAELHHEARFEMSFRLLGINAPEVVGPTKEAGLVSKAALDALLSHQPLLWVTSHKSDKYGRWLASIDIPQPDGSLLNANQYMLDHGYAVPYDGTGPRD